MWVWCGCVADKSKVIFFFFFQAEDGIRDKLVTGVQTCALPISLAGKIFKRHGGYAFEVGGMGAKFACGEEFFDERMDVGEGFSEGFVADLRAIDANAFVDFFE